MVWQRGKCEGGLSRGVRRANGRPGQEVEERSGASREHAASKAGPAKNGNSLTECKRAWWRVENGVAECEWRGRIVWPRAASGGPPGKRESGSNGSRCVHLA